MGRGGGGWGVKPEMTNVIFFYFFLMKASLSLHSPFYNKNTKSVNRDEDLISRDMTEQVRVLCWIMTGPENHKSKVKKVGKHYKTTH